MSVVRKNIIANFGGTAWQTLMSLAFIPLYIKFMGIESYGLVGIFASMLALFRLLDMGLSTTLNREMARLSVLPGKTAEMRDLVRTLEMIYWGMAIAIGIAVISLSSPIAYYWVKADKLAPSTIHQALMLMGGVLAFQWPVSLYSGGLRGLQKQVLLNCTESGVATLRGVGAVLVLWLISPTILAFFTWQIFMSLLNTSVMSVFLWRSIPNPGYRPHFQKNVIMNIWRFTAGLTGISLSTIILTQTDKIILSKILSLEMFGYYSLAALAASTLYRFIGPVYAALFPRFSQLVSLNDQDALRELYHKGCQFMSVMILPAAMVVSLFSSEILLLWTGNPSIVSNTHKVVSILIIGNVLNGLMGLPSGLQLAHAWTKLILYTNIIASIVFVPMIYFLCIRYGVVGAASSWVILNTGYVLICIQIMHSRLLKGEQWRWYLNDVGVPWLSALIIVTLWRLLIPSEMSKVVMLICLLGVSTTSLIVTAFTTSVTRQWIKQKFVMLKVLYES